ncbi:MAG: hypothetical protein HQL39_16330, partial [Alphaproteobacteria bacterium]|nr:hypothetical protein [Alphaproteobacteria bacterium]
MPTYIPQLWAARTVLAAIQDDDDVPAVPVAADAIEIFDAGPPSLEANFVEMKTIRPYMGAAPKVTTNVHRSTDMAVGLSGSGAAGTAPGWDTLMRCCSFAATAITGAATIQASPGTAGGGNAGTMNYVKGAAYAGSDDRVVTITVTGAGASGVAVVTISAPASLRHDAHNQAGVVVTDGQALALVGGATILPTIGAALDVGDVWTVTLTAPAVIYTPVSEGFEMATLHYHIDGQRRRFMNARGAMTALSLAAGAVPKIGYGIKGSWEAPTATARPAADFSRFRHPIPLSKTNTPRGRLFGRDLVISSIELKVAEPAVHRDVINHRGTMIDDRTMSGQIKFDLPPLADWDIESAVVNHDRGALEFEHGHTAGNIIRVTAPSVQLAGKPAYAKGEGGATEVTIDLT